MLSASLLRRLAVLVLVLSISVTPGAWAARPAARLAAPAKAAEPATLFGDAWNLLAALWAKTGCHVDPNGRCAPSPEPSLNTSDTGCNIDPNGRCHS